LHNPLHEHRPSSRPRVTCSGRPFRCWGDAGAQAVRVKSARGEGMFSLPAAARSDARNPRPADRKCDPPRHLRHFYATGVALSPPSATCNTFSSRQFVSRLVSRRRRSPHRRTWRQPIEVALGDPFFTWAQLLRRFCPARCCPFVLQGSILSNGGCWLIDQAERDGGDFR
jgi:hypothetical protein